FPNCQWAIARKKQVYPSTPGYRSIDFSRAETAFFQFPARYWATPTVFQELASFGLSWATSMASSTARAGARILGSGAVASSQARLLIDAWVSECALPSTRR